MGDPSHITELIEEILEETEEFQGLQSKILDLRDGLLHAQQETQQYALKLKVQEEVIQKLKSPAHRIGTVLGPGIDDLKRISIGTQEFQAAVSPEITEPLQPGDQVALNEAYVAICKLPRPENGSIARISTRLADGQWLVHLASGNAETMVSLREGLEKEEFKEGDEVILDPSQKIVLNGLPKRKAAKPIEDDFQKVSWSQVGGQKKIIDEVRKVIEYPILHAEIIDQMEYQLPKGFLFYGPPGCGKTLVGRAILTDVVKQLKEKEHKNIQGRFIHIKGPEILNMWLGESERKVREIFKKAREYREKDQMPFIFIDEAESILGTRQAWRTNNITNTLVPMFCAEMDGLQSLQQTVVILATNRPDMIDPAILRPGRIDRKIKVGRPNREGCAEILKIYLQDKLPRELDNMDEMIRPFLDNLFAKKKDQEVLVMTLKNGDIKRLYWKNFISGAIIEGVIKRAKEMAIERAIKGGKLFIKASDLTTGLNDEFTESGLLPSESNLEDWLQLLDIDPHKVARVRRPKDADTAVTDTLNRSMI